MSSIVTFLGKGGTGRTTIAIAAAKKLASRGQKVLLIGQDSSPAYALTLGISVTAEPQEIAANLSVVQMNSTVLLEQSWAEAKKLEQQYLRSPILKNVYGQELGILPGMDQALALNALREYDNSNKYDAIVYDGAGDLSTLRMFGMPEILSWYIRRFKGVFQESDIVKTLSPFVQPVTSAVLNVSWNADDLTSESTKDASQMLEKGKEALEDPQRVIAYLVTTADEIAIAKAQYLWGSAQQIGLTVGGVLLNQDSNDNALSNDFQPLPITSLPKIESGDWQTLIDALPSFTTTSSIPQPTSIEIAEKKIKVFLPGFDKKQVKLTQYGPEITIEAGDQRRNIILPPQWSGRSVTGAKFNNKYLELSIG
ncbi:oxyanion-translocating ATPase [Xenococcus sp. PCC 7305]|uniref:Get3/ArsA fold putative tail anchor-mediating ATPase NosAFP n=1 Tax=Xenococcus sp. PCC 7305 TaxID=102125 RepID=UPI0002AC62B8|nr:ArsA family ATPase [Xenococcus sp. PCC 7305]ELS03545.1 oxyanion-translocating ATPase [Xenococcus sp. PCC 7305]